MNDGSISGWSRHGDSSLHRCIAASVIGDHHQDERGGWRGGQPGSACCVSAGW
jgi:hypothetical protein